MKPRDYKLLPDGSIDTTQDGIGELFEPELEEIADALAHRTPHAHGPTAAERDDFERECRQWREALGKKVDDALRSDGIDVGRVLYDRVSSCFRVEARDARAQHRDYSVDIQVGEALALAELHDRAPFQAVVRDVVQRIREARATYMRRMGA